MNIPMDEWEWFGNAGHFICGHNCRFHLCTLVGGYLVSTVGQLPKRGPDSNDYEEIGFGRKFETMVFKAGEKCSVKDCGCGLPQIEGSELDTGMYNNAGAATRGHMKLCRKYAKVAR